MTPRDLQAEPCTCGVIKVGGRPTDSRNWNPDCPEHGTESVWWRSPEQVARRGAQSERLRDLNRQAREARGRVVPLQAEEKTR